MMATRGPCPRCGEDVALTVRGRPYPAHRDSAACKRAATARKQIAIPSPAPRAVVRRRLGAELAGDRPTADTPRAAPSIVGELGAATSPSSSWPKHLATARLLEIASHLLGSLEPNADDRHRAHVILSFAQPIAGNAEHHFRAALEAAGKSTLEIDLAVRFVRRRARQDFATGQGARASATGQCGTAALKAHHARGRGSSPGVAPSLSSSSEANS